MDCNHKPSCEAYNNVLEGCPCPCHVIASRISVISEEEAEALRQAEPEPEKTEEERFEEAKLKLHAAIMEFYHTVDPDVFVDDWVIIAHKESVELTQKGQSAVSHLSPTGQPWHRTVGLLSIAHQSARAV